MREIKLQDLKAQTPAELVSFAEEKGVENASTMRKQEFIHRIGIYVAWGVFVIFSAEATAL